MILLFHTDNKPQNLRLIIRKTVYLQKTVMPMYIHEHKEWPSFSWNKELVGEKLNKVNKAVGYLMGRLSVIGFNDKMSAVVESISHDIIASSEIEGVELNNEQVRSSVARKLGVQLPNPTESSRYIDGVVEMALDATVNFNSPLTHERLFGWHNCLFPTGWSGPTKIDVARYRSGDMKVISGMFGREKVHYVAPAPERIDEEMNRFLDWFNSDVHNGYVKSAIPFTAEQRIPLKEGYQVVYNLEMIFALAFQINTYPAQQLRKYIISRLFQTEKSMVICMVNGNHKSYLKC